MRSRFSFIITCLLPILSSQPSLAKELEVSVRTEARSVPVSVSLDFSASQLQAQEKRNYSDQLFEIFKKDLAAGDRLTPISTKTDAATTPLRVSLKIRYPELSASCCFSGEGRENLKLPPQLLSGILAEDRKKIHLLADNVHEALTGVPGICSGVILFTLSTSHQQNEESLKQGELWTIDYDGANLAQRTEEKSLSVTPRFIRSTSKFYPYLYVSYKTGVPKIFINTFDKLQGQRVISLRGNQLMPDISCHKNKLVFVSDINGNPDIFLQPFSLASGTLGKPFPLLNASFGTQGNPTFSPDGTKILFVSNKDGSPRIYIMPIEPEIGAPYLLTKRYRNCSCPSWSNNGRFVAFCAVVKGFRQIFVHDLATKEDLQLTFSPENKENPSWAKDDWHLVFSSGSSDKSDIYLLSIFTKKTTKITSGPGEKRFPSWGAFASQPKRLL
ncbi:Tol-Pal system protein TolB [Chlamydiifrater phoenicopteri]|uniref:Tol-Pal system protein TolB n=1 Tax=Chlamydiifrater phoenicopteri TaxID=2681469 RepID=UPI001BD06153|nr:Tol-Pal system protein TolB [Chlamydiifrater phoenicopteri]